MSSTSRRTMTLDIHESIRLVLGKQQQLLLKCPVLKGVESKGESKAILVLTAHRVFVMSPKVPTKVEQHVHILDIQAIESKRNDQLTLSFENKSHGFRLPVPASSSSSLTPTLLDTFLSTLVKQLRRIFPGVPVPHVLPRLEVLPWSRVSEAFNFRPSSVGPCGNFSAQYFCVCDQLGVPFREEVAWDVDTIYFSHDSTDFALHDFEHLDSKDLGAVVQALEHNSYFTKITATAALARMTQQHEICDKLLSVISKSVSLNELHLQNAALKTDFGLRLANAINKDSKLQLLDLAHNNLEDKAVMAISNATVNLSQGLRHLNLSHCGFASKGANALSSALVANRANLRSLTYLNLSGNALREEWQALCNFLSKPNCIAILDLSGTETPLDALFGALVRGCITSLTHLNLARNPFSTSKKSKEVSAAFKQFFAGSLAFQYANLSHTKLPSEALKHLLLGLACNEHVSNVELNLSSNNLGSQGAVVVENCVGGVNSLSRLDLSDNGIEAEMSGVMQGLLKNKSVLSLNVSRNMVGVKAKYLSAVMESIVQLLQDEESALQKLNLADCKLKNEIHNVINALGSNQCLQHLDISGNQMGDVGARLMAKALQINTRLRTLILDRNNISLQGYSDIAYALQTNYALRHIPFPTFDIQPLVKTHPERVDVILHRMQELLNRNASPHRFRNASQAFRLTQGFIMSSTQQILDRSAAQTQDNIEAYLKMKSEPELRDVSTAQGLIAEAEQSKHLLSALHEATASKGSDVDSKLKSFSVELNKFIEDHVRRNLELMLTCSENQCPLVMAEKRTAIEEACRKKCQFSSEFIENLVLDQLGLEVHNKINELNLILANHISDRVIDDVIERLGNVSKHLVTTLNSSGHNMSTSSSLMTTTTTSTTRRERSITPELFKTRSGSQSERRANEEDRQETASLPGVNTNTDDDNDEVVKRESPIATTPHAVKRKSIQGRRLRPKSIVDKDSDDINNDIDGDAPAADNEERQKEETEDDIFAPSSSLSSSTLSATASTALTAPTTTTLRHLGKSRPRRPKNHAPSRNSMAPRRSESSTSDLFKHKLDSSSSVTPVSPVAESVPEPSSRRTLSPSLSAFSSLLSRSLTSPKASPPDQSALSVSPFASRRSEDSMIKTSTTPITTTSTAATTTTTVEKSIDVVTSRPSPEAVVKRIGVGHGGNAGLMAEFKEKRASIIPKSPVEPINDAVGSKAKSSDDDSKEKGDTNSSSGLFGRVRLRSTGLAANLTSPTTDFQSSSLSLEPPTTTTATTTTTVETVSNTRGSIVGLRASKFASQTSASALLKSSPSSSSPSSSSNVPKPKPLPKPRPWSIVGVDRKSGEMSRVPWVSAGGDEVHREEDEVRSKSEEMDAKVEKKTSVRDLINNMNKAGTTKTTTTTTTTTPSASSAEDSDLSSSRRQRILPSTTPTMTSSLSVSLTTSSSTSGEPKESMSDDPRILKLDDDFAFEDGMEV